MGAKVHPRIVSGPTWKMARNTVSPAGSAGLLTGCRAGVHARTLVHRAHCYDDEVIQPANQSVLRTVFLDRDGILNEKMPEHRYVTRWEEFRVLPGVPEALRRLNEAGLRVVVVSNQRGIAKGLYTAADLDAMHAKFQSLLALEGAHIDAFFICPHETDECNCRKPLPGLFEQAVARFPRDHGRDQRDDRRRAFRHRVWPPPGNEDDFCRRR